MGRLTRYYDLAGSRTTLNKAIALTLMTEVFFIIGVVGLMRYLKNPASYRLIDAAAFLLLGALGIIHGSRIIHAVVRRLVAEGPRGT